MPMAGCEVFSICSFPYQEGTGVKDPGNWGHSGETGRWPGEGCPCYSFLLDWAALGRVGRGGQPQASVHLC